MSAIRLTRHQLRSITKCFDRHFSIHDNIWLFGSRVDPDKRGGDIDLYIETQNADVDIVQQQKRAFLIALKSLIGNQKIDIVVRQINSSNHLLIHDEAKSTGIMLKHQLLQDYIRTADMHARRLSNVLDKAKPLIPITTDQCANLDDMTLGLLEIMTTRFSKLQDIVGEKVFTLTLEALKEKKATDSFIDKLNKLEKLGYLSDAGWWEDLRDLRNELAHEYPDEDYNVMSNNINTCASQSGKLLQFWNEFKEKLHQANLIQN